jgi:hypothetical protein
MGSPRKEAQGHLRRAEETVQEAQSGEEAPGEADRQVGERHVNRAGSQGPPHPVLQGFSIRITRAEGQEKRVRPVRGHARHGLPTLGPFRKAHTRYGAGASRTVRYRHGGRLDVSRLLCRVACGSPASSLPRCGEWNSWMTSKS